MLGLLTGDYTGLGGQGSGNSREGRMIWRAGYILRLKYPLGCWRMSYRQWIWRIRSRW